MGREVPGGRAVLAGGGAGGGASAAGSWRGPGGGRGGDGGRPERRRRGCQEEADSLARSRPRPWPREGKHRRDPKAQERR